MSNTSKNNKINQGSYFPVWAPHLVMAAVVLTGLVLAWGGAMLPFGFFILFAVAMVLATALVEPRGLFLTVFSYPLWFFFGVLFIGLVSPTNGASYSLKTKVATAVYPAVEEYLWLAIPFLISAVIAALRWWLYRERLDRQRARATQRRQRRSQAERSNREMSQQARTRSGSRSRSRARGEEPAVEQNGQPRHTPIRSQQRYSRRNQVRTQEEIRRSSAERRKVQHSGRRSFHSQDIDQPLLDDRPKYQSERSASGVERRQYPIPPSSTDAQPRPTRRRETPRHYLEEED